jgi:hypothetical protein
MNIVKNWWRRRRAPALDPVSGTIVGVGLALILFGNLMVPSYGASDLQHLGIAPSAIAGLASVANLAVAAACLFLAIRDGQLGRRPLGRAFGVAGVMLFLPAIVPPTWPGPTLLWALGGSLFLYALSGSIAHFSAQVHVVDRAPVDRKSRVIGSYLKYHLVAGVVLGGLPFFFGWRIGELALAGAALLLAAGTAVWRAAPTPEAPTTWRSPAGLFRDTGVGVLVLGVGQFAWTGAYLIPGVLALPAAVVAAYAAVAQLVAGVLVGPLTPVVDRNRWAWATLTAGVLVPSLLAVAIFPGLLPHPVLGATLGQWLAGFFFTLVEASANLFITAVEGLLSLERQGKRSQLAGQSCKFATVAAGGFLMTIVTAQLEARHLPPAQVGIGVGVCLGVTLAVGFAITLTMLRARNHQAPGVPQAVPVAPPSQPLPNETQPSPALAATQAPRVVTGQASVTASVRPSREELIGILAEAYGAGRLKLIVHVDASLESPLVRRTHQVLNLLLLRAQVAVITRHDLGHLTPLLGGRPDVHYYARYETLHPGDAEPWVHRNGLLYEPVIHGHALRWSRSGFSAAERALLGPEAFTGTFHRLGTRMTLETGAAIFRYDIPDFPQLQAQAQQAIDQMARVAQRLGIRAETTAEGTVQLLPPLGFSTGEAATDFLTLDGKEAVALIVGGNEDMVAAARLLTGTHLQEAVCLNIGEGTPAELADVNVPNAEAALDFLEELLAGAA